jgi:hypothetical protein
MTRKQWVICDGTRAFPVHRSIPSGFAFFSPGGSSASGVSWYAIMHPSPDGRDPTLVVRIGRRRIRTAVDDRGVHLHAGGIAVHDHPADFERQAIEDAGSIGVRVVGVKCAGEIPAEMIDAFEDLIDGVAMNDDRAGAEGFFFRSWLRCQLWRRSGRRRRWRRVRRFLPRVVTPAWRRCD